MVVVTHESAFRMIRCEPDKHGSIDQACRQLKPLRRREQAPVPRPKPRAGRQAGRRQKMHIDPSNADAEKRLPLNEVKDFFVTGDGRGREIKQIGQSLALARLPQGKFAKHIWMTEHQRLLQQRRQPGVAVAQVINPDRGIYQDHVGKITRAPSAVAAQA
jgi:hypothetical protein